MNEKEYLHLSGALCDIEARILATKDACSKMRHELNELRDVSPVRHKVGDIVVVVGADKYEIRIGTPGVVVSISNSGVGYVVRFPGYRGGHDGTSISHEYICPKGAEKEHRYMSKDEIGPAPEYEFKVGQHVVVMKKYDQSGPDIGCPGVIIRGQHPQPWLLVKFFRNFIKKDPMYCQPGTIAPNYFVTEFQLMMGCIEEKKKPDFRRWQAVKMAVEYPPAAEMPDVGHLGIIVGFHQFKSCVRLPRLEIDGERVLVRFPGFRKGFNGQYCCEGYSGASSGEGEHVWVNPEDIEPA